MNPISAGEIHTVVVWSDVVRYPLALCEVVFWRKSKYAIGVLNCESLYASPALDLDAAVPSILQSKGLVDTTLCESSTPSAWL